ncbi:P-loop containing nucleoside triphosphate hydrolase protein [Cercophora newfieldiana]|uniref:P-loop containing nucleoside triphosphate hydrolase protein n=1 Tax=Cercophora newfieldiana TaxID=92897 RepID=A0AA40CPN7_9PEZI|nr:P-loop containing nucleoside triphosphate hydrolase protein [Cercophora newfieldiana]
MSSKRAIPTMVHHSYLFLDQRLKDAHLVHLCNEAQRASQATAIFTRSVSETRRVSLLLNTLNIGAISLQSDLSPSTRAASLDKLRRKECHVVVTTDVAAGFGPMIPKVDRIINFSLVLWKLTPETYTKRIGNVKNHVGSSGLAITFVTQYDIEVYMRLEKILGVPLAEYAVDMDMIMLCKGQVEEAAL